MIVKINGVKATKDELYTLIVRCGLHKDQIVSIYRRANVLYIKTV